mgnify:CR=1 FL=1
MSLSEDYGKPDVYGPWTNTEDCYNVNGNIKFFKSYWFITTNSNSADIEGSSREWKRKQLLKNRRNKLEAIMKKQFDEY